MKQDALEAHSPSAVGLARLSTRLSIPPGGDALYHSILQRVDLSDASEFVMVPCGRGRSSLFIAEATAAGGAGTDPDPVMVEVATRRATRAGLGARLHFENAPLDELPYQDAVFDLAVAEVEFGATPHPAAAVRELARVTKPGGTVALVQLVWTRPIDTDREDDLADRLGVRPLTPDQWRRMLSDAGVEGITVEDWPDPSTAHREQSVLGGLAELFTFRGKVRLLPRAWKRWGWRGVRLVLSRERELRRLVEEEGVLGVSLITGTCPAEPKAEEDHEEHSE